MMKHKIPVEWMQRYESEAFARETACSGPLGAAYTPEATTFRLWTPLAEAVSVDLYPHGNGGGRPEVHPMERDAQGVWSITLPGDQNGRYYTYTVQIDGKTQETGDPYAVAAGVNGLRSMVLDLDAAAPAGWQDDRRPDIPPQKRVVWEVSVRDFSQDAASGVRPDWRGKFLAFTQPGTTLCGDGTHPTCLNYLQQLGVGYVQIMPMYDFGSVDEAKPLTKQSNWGYDPINFNVPEGSYSTDPYHGEVRIRECRTMIQALHKAGIGVIMDVVYNHTYRHENVLNHVMPGYFFRENEDGSYSDGSGCSNEFASERPMARRYLIDSVLYWAKEYHLDGFRFDLMEIYDVETMNLLRAALDELPGGESILMYGEPWKGGPSVLQQPAANKDALSLLDDRIGVFCDNTRDAIKGHCFYAREAGYVNGRPDMFPEIRAAVTAWCCSDALPEHAPGQIVSYVSAHDNYTLWDKLLLVRTDHPDYNVFDPAVLAENRLAAGIYLTCMGIPFLQAGEEFARTKKGEDNSYASSALLNQLDWKRTAACPGLVEYYRGLIGLRNAFPRLSAPDPDTPRAVRFLPVEAPLVGWVLPAGPERAAWKALCVFYNPLAETRVVSLPEGRWKLLSDGTTSALWQGESTVCTGEFSLPSCSAVIFGLL